ncbi:MAG: tryptophan--tRNA ligase [Desulfobulbaceae bacterium]|nr:tryptophan--tRNA ligase [Desulfobulbaceae bacterium]
MSNLLSVRLFDPKSEVNWYCEKCHMKFGEIPNENGLVRCPNAKCNNTNSKSSQNNILYKRAIKKGDKGVRKQKRVLSGIRPTGNLHLGNYLGAVKQFVELQEEDLECLFFVADLHALTTLNEPEQIDKNTVHVVRAYLACGLDPDKSIIYRQSDVPEIPYLATLLGMITPEPLLRRCTTFKDKADKQETVSLGLLAYPVLMAADILIAEAEIVPVGEDQLQHLEIIRDIAGKFNFNFGKGEEILKLPQARQINAIRVPGLDGTGKMGKSEGNTIDLIEEPDSIRKKVLAAKTDLGPIRGEEMSQEIKNLYYLMELCSSKETYDNYLELHQKGEQKFYGKLKTQLAEDIIELLAPIRERYYSDICSEERVRSILCMNKDRLRPLAGRVLRSVQSAFGLHDQVLELQATKNRI